MGERKEQSAQLNLSRESICITKDKGRTGQDRLRSAKGRERTERERLGSSGFCADLGVFRGQ